MSHPVLARLSAINADERRNACIAAAEDPSATLLIEALGEALGDTNKAVARAASDALVQIARVEPAVTDVVRTALRSGDPRRRFAAAFTSVRLEPPGPHLVPALIGALESADGDVRWSAARMLVDVGRLNGEVLGVLLALLRAGDQPVVRRMAAFCLRELAPDEPAVAHALVAASEDGDVHVRRAALAAMAALLDPPQAVLRRLVALLDGDGDASSRHIAAVALGELGAADGGVLPAGTRERLERLAAGGDDTDLRRAAARALARLGAERTTSIPD